MHTSIDKWGNSLGLRIPAFLAKKLGIKVGTSIEVDVVDDKLIISKKEESETLASLLKGITKENLHVDYLRDAAKGNEVW
jgi:antitoxin MazE